MPASVKEAGVAIVPWRREGLLAVLFAAAYGQWPLYSSNQNTYFLRGVAWASGGPLQSDWLARTTDHVPLFTAYVFVVTRWLGPAVFFLVHAGLVAVYALCLSFLVRRVFEWTASSSAYHVFFVLLTLLHSDAVAAGLASIGSGAADTPLAAMRLLTEGVAGEPLLRHFHQPSAFGVLLLVSTCLFVGGRSSAAVAFAALAPWFHPAYFLPSALLAAVYATHALRHGRYRRAAAVGTIWLASALPPLLYTISLFRPSSSEVASEASRILVHERFPHHADPGTWFGWPTVLQLTVALAGLLLARRDRRLFAVLAALLATASALSFAQILSGSDALALLLPWRLSVLAVPVSTALLVAWTVAVASPVDDPSGRRGRWTRRVCLLLLAIAAAAGILTTLRPVRANQYPTELAARVRDDCAPGDVYLVPPQWQWFRLATSCPILVDRKSHPYKDVEVLEWWARLRAASSFYEADTPQARAERLAVLSSRWRVTHVVVEDGGAEGEGAGSRWRVLSPRTMR